MLQISAIPNNPASILQKTGQLAQQWSDSKKNQATRHGPNRFDTVRTPFQPLKPVTPKPLKPMKKIKP
jgi:hypothetical protein